MKKKLFFPLLVTGDLVSCLPAGRQGDKGVFSVETDGYMELRARLDIINLLNKRVDAFSKGYRQNIALIGEELIGKSFLLEQWLSAYCNPHIVAVYINVSSGPISGFSERFIGSLFFSFLKDSQAALKDDLNHLLEKSSSYIPKTCALAQRLLAEGAKRNKRPAETFIRLLELVELLHSESSKCCVIILDEFDRLGEENLKHIYEPWRRMIMLNKETMYILSSSRKQLVQRILLSDLNLLFGNFEKIEVFPFDNKASRALVSHRLKGLNLSDDALEFMISLGSGRPFYLNALAAAIIDYQSGHKQEARDIGFLTSCWEGIFLDSCGILNRRFSWLIKEMEGLVKEEGLYDILISVSKGLNSADKISRQLNLPRKKISAILNRLSAEDHIVKSGDIYTFNDAVFCFWLRHVYAWGFKSFAADAQRRKDAFGLAIKEAFKVFSEAQSKETAQRIVELFNQFGNEAVELRKKRLRLDRFQEVKLLDLKGKNIKTGIVARTRNSLWIAGFKEGRAEEGDLAEFAQVCKRLRNNKPQKKIFISLDEIDANASLIAKENRIFTWDTETINSLFDIYDKPKIVK